MKTVKIIKTVKFETVEQFLNRGGLVTVYGEGQKTKSDKVNPMPAKRFILRRDQRVMQRSGVGRSVRLNREFSLGYAATNWNRIGAK
jgi:hypothetical protein